MKYSKWQKASKVQPAHDGGYQWRCKHLAQKVLKTKWSGTYWVTVDDVWDAPSQTCICEWGGRID